MTEIIRSKDNGKIKRFGKLASSNSYRRQEGAFVIESVKLVLEAFQSGVQFETVFVTESCLEKMRAKHDPLSEKFFQQVELTPVDPSLENKLSQAKTPQGIYAICKILDKSLRMSTIYSRGNYCFLSGLQDPGNVGTIIRTAEAFGIDGIILSEDCCDRYHPKVLRAAMGTAFRIPMVQIEDTKAFLQNAKAHGCKTIASVVTPDATDIKELRYEASNILLIGNEGNGIAPDTVSACTDRTTIHMRGKAESLNAAMAAGVLLWEMVSHTA